MNTSSYHACDSTLCTNTFPTSDGFWVGDVLCFCSKGCARVFSQKHSSVIRQVAKQIMIPDEDLFAEIARSTAVVS